MKTAEQFLKDKGLQDMLFNIPGNPGGPDWVEGGLSKLLDEFAAQRPTTTSDRTSEMPTVEQWTDGVQAAHEAVQSLKAAQSPAISRERLVEIIENNVLPMSEYGIEGVSHAADAILSELGQPADPYPDTEADGLAFCGKCGKQK